MPFTPFHFGPGMLVKSLAPRRFWLTSFLAANVLIDVEVLYLIWRGERPYHRYFHTYVGGTIAGILAGAGMYAVVLSFHRLLPRRHYNSQLLATQIDWRLLLLSIISGLVGGWSHVFLDSLVHHEVQPFLPFSGGNHLAHTVNLRALYLGLAVSGLIGLVIWLWDTKIVE